MADEIKLRISATVENGEFKDAFNAPDLRFDQAAIGGHRPVVKVGTSEEDVPIGDVATLGWLVMKNLDDTNYVTWGPKSAGAMVAVGRLEPGEPAVFRLEPGITLRWVADTAEVKVDLRIYED